MYTLELITIYQGFFLTMSMAVRDYCAFSILSAIDQWSLHSQEPMVMRTTVRADSKVGYLLVQLLLVLALVSEGKCQDQT